MECISGSPQDTQAIAAKIAKQLKTGGVVGLIGDLGAGKTTFSQGFAQALGIREKIISPTFILIRPHPLPNRENTLYHVDLYRLEGDINTKELGLEEVFQNTGGDFVLIEWADKILDKLPPKTLLIDFEKTPGDGRKITTKLL